MESVYLLLKGNEWEDIVVFLNEKEAIDASIKYSKSRVEIFSKNNNIGYKPTYNYYQNGTLVENS